MANWFDKDYYLQLKLLQLDATGQRNGIQDIGALEQVLADAGMTAESHYLTYGHLEGLNPNAYFNETEYLHAKLAQLNDYFASEWAGKSIEELRDFLATVGLTPLQHYETHGAFEARADGTLLNPSNGFDANAYMQAKLVQLQHDDPSTPLNVQNVLTMFREAGLSPAAHAITHGQAESDNSGVDMVQTVPDSQRVATDPARGAINSTVPGNSAAPSVGPSGVTTPHEVINPYDMADVALPTPQPVAQAPDPAPNPTPDPTPDPSPNPGPAPEPGPGYKYDDLIITRYEGNTLYLEVNEDSQAYGLLFAPAVVGRVELDTPRYASTPVEVSVRNHGTPYFDGDSFEYTEWAVTIHLDSILSIKPKLMVDQKIVVPAGTAIDLLNLPGKGWNWHMFSVANWLSDFSDDPGLIVSGPGITANLRYSVLPSKLGFNSVHSWETEGVVEILSNTSSSALRAQTFENIHMADDADDDRGVPLVGVDLFSDEASLT